MESVNVDHITQEVIRNAMLAITREMDYVVGRSSGSTLWQESGDYSTAILTNQGDMVAQGPTGIPVHMGTMPMSVKFAFAKLGRENMKAGDIIWHNDPYLGSNHIPDVLLAQPVFYDGEFVATSAVRGHWLDIGGSTPGSYSSDNRDIYAEGIRAPPTKIYSKGKLNESLLDVVLTNVRLPQERLMDFRAQVAGCLMGEQRVVGLFKKYGKRIMLASMDRILNHAERMVRAEIRKMPSGVYEATDFLDGDEVEKKLLKIHARVEIKGDRIKVDFAGTDGEAVGGVNAPYAVTCTSVYYTVKVITDPEIPSNSGAYRPIEVTAPEGTLLNPRPPAPVVLGNHETGNRIVDVLLKAFSQAIPDKVVAGLAGSAQALVIGGEDSRAGRKRRGFLFLSPVNGGRGACRGGDGINVIRTGTINAKIPPVEVIENRNPLLVSYMEIVADSGGVGRWRGGCSSRAAYELLTEEATLTTLADRAVVAPFGLFEGGDGCKTKLVMKKGREEENLFSKFTGEMKKGDVFVFQPAGGGGYGNPLEREPEMVRSDFLDGYVSLRSAENDYGVVMNADTGEIDAGRTASRREELKRRMAPSGSPSSAASSAKD